MQLDSYIETALWSSTDENGEPMDAKYSMEDLTAEFLEQSVIEMNAFLDKARPYFTDEELEHGNIEHDFWLTRNRHGAGFWDGDYENGDKLTEIAHEFGEVELTEYLK